MEKKRITLAELFRIDEKASIPIWLQLKNRFIYLITSGHYLPGSQLPTVRSLAADIGINYNTVSKVYKSLEEDGYIVSRHRQGVFVCDVSDKPGVSLAASAQMITVEYIQRCLELGLSLDEVSELFEQNVQRLEEKCNRKQEEFDESAKPQKAGASIVCMPSTAGYAEQRSLGNGA